VPPRAGAGPTLRWKKRHPELRRKIGWHLESGPRAWVGAAADVEAIRLDVCGYRAEICPLWDPCPVCPGAPNANLQPICQMTQCSILDVRTHESSECSTDLDCEVRASDCCGCSGGQSIALNPERAGAYYTLVCDPAADCPPCTPPDPTVLEAFCASDGHCDLRPVP